MFWVWTFPSIGLRSSICKVEGGGLESLDGCWAILLHQRPVDISDDAGGKRLS